MSEQSKKISVEIEDVDPKEAAELMKLFSSERTGFVRVGPKGYFLPHKFKGMADQIYNLPLRNDDIFIVTYARSVVCNKKNMSRTYYKSSSYQEKPQTEQYYCDSGAHMANDLDFDTAAKVHLKQRFPFLEYSSLSHPLIEKELFEKNSQAPENVKFLKNLFESSIDVVTRMRSPRFIKSHLPLSLLPPTLLDNTKVVYMARDPRDVAFSYFCHCKNLKLFGFTGDFKDFWILFVKDMVHWSPFFEHLKEAWNMRHHPNMLFMFYEDLIEDMPSCIHRVSKLLGKEYSENDIERLCDHLSIKNFKKNKSITLSYEAVGMSSKEFNLVRRGKSGGWRDHFDEEMTLEAERWMEENLRDTDMRFPKHN